MDQDLISRMERAALDQLPRQPGWIIPGWFGSEWMLVGIAMLVIVAIAYGFATLVSMSAAHAYSMTPNPCVDARNVSDYCTKQRFNAELEAMRRKIEQSKK